MITNQKEKLSIRQLIIILIVCIFVLFLWRAFLPNTAFYYCKPLIIIEGVCVFLLFAKLHIKSKAINILAPASFSCFLINGQLLRFIGFEWLAGKSLFGVLGGMLAELIGIYLVAFVAMNTWNFVTKPIFRHTFDKIPKYELEE